MSDNKEDDKVLEEIRQAIEDFAVAEVRGYLRVVKSLGTEVSWESYGRRLMNVYMDAIKSEMGEDAAQAFSRGVFGRLGN